MRIDNKKRKKNYSKFIIVAVLALIIIGSVAAIVMTVLPDLLNRGNQPEVHVETVGLETQIPVQTIAPAEDSSQTAQGAQANVSDPIQPKQVDRSTQTASTTQTAGKKIIVLDPGHGISTSQLSADELEREGYVKNGGAWGEWRHWVSGSNHDGCGGCNLPSPSGAGCWYSIGNSDRDKEPEINLNNALNAKKYLEQMGYTVRMTRNESEHPAFSSRISLCYSEQRTAVPPSGQEPDADIYVCIHSNAGGGRGSAYIKAGGTYGQSFKNGMSASDYAESCNALGSAINSRITAQTNLSPSGPIGGEEALIAFCKSPIPVGYLEIGFYDNSSDLSVLRSESDRIGQAIAEGIDDYFSSH